MGIGFSVPENPGEVMPREPILDPYHPHAQDLLFYAPYPCCGEGISTIHRVRDLVSGELATAPLKALTYARFIDGRMKCFEGNDTDDRAFRWEPKPRMFGGRAYTFSCFFREGPGPGRWARRIWDYKGSSAGLMVYTGQGELWLGSPTTEYLLTSYTQAEWNHWGISFKCGVSGIRVYKNGIFHTEYSATISSVPQPDSSYYLWLGNRPDFNRQMYGHAQHVRLWGRELNARDHYEIYRWPNASIIPTSARFPGLSSVSVPPPGWSPEFFRPRAQTLFRH